MSFFQQSSHRDGILILDKPKGYTSAQLVGMIKKKFHLNKVGHGGTLDPLATGVLPICVDRATKMASYLLESDKIYEGTFLLGLETDTHDIEGKILQEMQGVSVSDVDLQRVMEGYLGEIEQVPPMFSAVKKAGKPLYVYARQEEEVPRSPRRIHVYAFYIKDRKGNEVSFHIHCSKGTYVRTLCHDLAKMLGTVACLKDLRRLKTGDLEIRDAIAWNDLSEENFTSLPHWKSLQDMFSGFPHKMVSRTQSECIRQGKSPVLSNVELRSLQQVKCAFLLDHEQRPLAIVKPYPPGQVFKLLKVFQA